MFQHSAQVQVLGVFLPGRPMRLLDIQRDMMAARGRTFSDITVRQALGHLVKAGKLHRVESGLYMLPGHMVKEYPLRDFVFKRLDHRLAVSPTDLKRDYRTHHGSSLPVDVFARELVKLLADGYAMRAPKHPDWYLATGKRLDAAVSE